MSSIFSITEIFIDEGIKSSIDLLDSIIGILGSLCVAALVCIRYFSKPRGDNQEFLSKAGVSNWLIKLFAISIPLKEVPENTRSDKIISGLIISILMSSLVFFSHMHIQTLRIQKGWTLLTLTATQENFFINHDSAKDSSLFNRHPWLIKKEDCANKKIEIIQKENGISIELARFICQSFINKAHQEKINDYINETDKEKSIIYQVISTIEIIILWISVNIACTLIFKKRVRDYIISQQKKAQEYIT
ncbi:TPA: hypothetical protein SLN67_004422 [Serratia marcescens]|nr:hypothetical protein [Serratia marcescens]